MLDIANKITNSYNGLSGDGDKVPKDPGTDGGNVSGNGNGWQIAQDMINTTANAFATVNDSLNNNNNSSNSGYNYMPTYIPANYNTSKKSDFMDYLPWILGGLGVITLVLVVTKKK